MQFPPSARLRQAEAFRLVFRDGRRFVRSGLVVIARHSAHDTARLGLAIAKRRVPRAADRNRIKRVIRESFRSRRATLGHFDIVVLARNHTGNLSNQRLFGQLDDVWSQIQTQRHPDHVHEAEHRHL